jgi:hypothetical protein
LPCQHSAVRSDGVIDGSAIGALGTERGRAIGAKGIYASPQDGAGTGPEGADCAGLRGRRQNKEVAASLGLDDVTVGKWRRRFVERRMEGLYDEPRSGAPRTIDDIRVEGVIVKTLESLPAPHTHECVLAQPAREILRATDRQKRSDAASIGAWPRSSAISIPSFATTMPIPGRSGGQNPQTISSPQWNASVDTMPMPEPENVANFWFRTLERDGIRLNHIRSWRSSLRVRLM